MRSKPTPNSWSTTSGTEARRDRIAKMTEKKIMEKERTLLIRHDWDLTI